MHRECDGRSERGVVLVITMMALLVLVGLTGALIPLTSTETSIVANHRRAVQILYAADAALEWVIQDLQREPSWDSVLSGSRQSSLRVGGSQHRLADETLLDLERVTSELRSFGVPARVRTEPDVAFGGDSTHTDRCARCCRVTRLAVSCSSPSGLQTTPLKPTATRFATRTDRWCFTRQHSGLRSPIVRSRRLLR